MQPLFKVTAQRTLVQVSVAEIEPPAQHGARDSVTASVGRLGIRTPLELYRLPPGGPFTYGITAGTRRYHAAVTHGITDVPAFVSDAYEPDVTGTENLCRSANPVAEALALRAKQAQGYDLKQVAQEWGAPIGTLRKRAKLLELPDWVLAVTGERVALGVVETIAGLSEPYRGEVLAALQAKLMDPDAKFTADDLRAARTAQDADLGAVLGSALMDAQPLVTVDPVQDLAARVRAMASVEGVDVADLARALSPLAPPEGTPSPVVTPPPATEPGAATPSRVRPLRFNVA